MVKEKIELTLQDESGQEYVAYPFVESEDVTLSNGMDIETMIAQDVSMPIVAHEETSFKVGVGDSDISNSIVDSSVANMTIKGQTYQNILPDPTLRNSMTDGKTMQKLNEGYESVNTVDGVCKSAILKGQTLVNKASIVGRIIANDGWNNLSIRLNYPLSINSKYLINVFNLPSGMNYVLTNSTNSNWIMPLYVNKKTVFVSQCNSDDIITLHVNDSSTYRPLTQEEINKIQVIIIEYQEGMENWDIPYFEGMQSVKMPVLKTVGKNLFNLENSKMNEKSSYDMKFNIYGYWTYIVKLKPNTTYTISRKNTDGYGKGFMFRINTKFDYIDAPWIVASHSQNENRQQKTVTTGTDGYLYFFVNNNLEKINNLLILCDYIQVEEGSTATPYEPFKSNILSTSEEVVLRGIGDVRDELDLVTGEVTERIDEVVLDGSERWSEWRVSETSYGFALRDYKIDFKPRTIPICDILPSINYVDAQSQTVDKGIALYTAGSESSYSFFIRLPKTECTGLEDFKTKIQQNPITVQYQLATESIKTVDLSSSGNWEKVVLDGSDNENWGKYSSGLQDSDKTKVYYMRVDNLVANWSSVVGLVTNSTKYAPITGNRIWNSDNIGITNDSAQIIVRCDVRDGETVDRWKQYLQQNPITVWYQTTVSQENSIREMLSFANGHVQLSSAEGSLIPSLNYETPTSNSYQLDLAKTNTKYTMKSSSANGNFTIDGTQYNFNTNGTFTTPSTMNNKLMIANGTVTDLMFIEGDVTSKTIPYFKGIKSAFEDEDKIEVLSTGKNLFDITKIENIIQNNRFKQEVAENTIKIETLGVNGAYYSDNKNFPILLTEGKAYTLTYDYEKTGNANAKVRFFTIVDGGTKTYVGDDGFTGNFTFKAKSTDVVYMSFYSSTSATSTVGDYVIYKNIQLEESSTETPHQSYKSNSTKIPLLSPLRSLPNGVCDEIVVDRMSNKAKLIQRVGSVVLDGSESWTNATSYDNGDVTLFYNSSSVSGVNSKKEGDTDNLLCSEVMVEKGKMAIANYELIYLYTNENRFYTKINKSKADSISKFRTYIQNHPITVYYELAIPIITEIDLEGFPYIYKDGHIFLNTDIAPTSEITYSINQQQQIEASNEDLMRHEKKITNLHKLIGTYVNVEYESTLLALNLELK